MRSIVLSMLLTLSACRSYSLYRDSDCEIPPEKYGQCYVENGYVTTSYDSLADYCAGRGHNVDREKFTAAHLHTVNEVCSDPAKVFTLAYRAVTKRGGPETCPKSSLTTGALKQAAEDGSSAAHALVAAQENEEEAKRADEKQSDEGTRIPPIGAYVDRKLLMKPDDYRVLRDQALEKSRRLREHYPTITEAQLNSSSRGACNLNGYF
jgi:hypothetical protein